MTSNDAKLIWYQALSSQTGALVLRASNPTAARQRLYGERSKLSDPQLAGIEIRLVELRDGGNLVMVKRPSLEELL